MERSAQKMPRLPELQEMDNKQLNESLSQFYTEAPGKVVANFVFFFWTYLRNCFEKSFTAILPICNDVKSSSLNGRRFHFHSRFEILLL